MGKTIKRVAAAVVTGGMSEVAGLTGKALAKPLGKTGASIVSGVIGGGPLTTALTKAVGSENGETKAPSAAVDKLPTMDDIKGKIDALVSDTSDPLAQMKRRARTLLTGGLGVTGDESVVRKTLLGV